MIASSVTSIPINGVILARRTRRHFLSVTQFALILMALQRLENSQISWWNRSLLLKHCLLTLNNIFLFLEFALHNGSFVEKRTAFTIYEDKYRIIFGFHKLTCISILRGIIILQVYTNRNRSIKLPPTPSKLFCKSSSPTNSDESNPSNLASHNLSKPQLMLESPNVQMSSLLILNLIKNDDTNLTLS